METGSKILIAIPSKNRNDTLIKNTWSWVQFVEGVDIVVFVEPQDIGKYDNIPMRSLVNILKNDQGLGYVKTVIKQYAQDHNYSFVFKLDDDIKSFTVWRKTLKEPREKAAHFNKVIQKSLEIFNRYSKVKAVTFPYSFQIYDKVIWKKVKRASTAYFSRTADFHADIRISVFEDFVVGLAILLNNGALLQYGLSGIELGVEVGGGTGGHQSFDRKEQAFKEAEILKELYPPITFRKVDKPWVIEPDMRSIKL